MAVVKFKSGDKNTLLGTQLLNPSAPLPIEAGTVYFAIDDNNKGSIYFDKDNSTRVLMSEAFSEYAEQANADTAGHAIRDYYLHDITFNSTTDSNDGNKIKVIATLTTGTGETTDRILPIAGPGLAGVITPAAQTIAGNKTFSGATTLSGGATFSNVNFDYSAIEAANSNAARVVWFADSSKRGKPVYDTDFTYNPSTNTLTATNFAGTATAATYDGAGSSIAIRTYLHDVDVSGTTLTFTRGNGQTVEKSIQTAIIRRWAEPILKGGMNYEFTYR